MDRPAVPSGNFNIQNRSLGMILFLAGDAMFFAGIAGAYVFFRHAAGPSWRPASGFLDADMVAAATGVMVSSALALFISAVQFKKEKRFSGLVLIWISFLSALFFLLIQFVESRQLILIKQILPSAGVSEALFYLLSGFHVLHSLVGTVFLGRSAIYASLGRSCGQETLRLFWGFTAAVWLALTALFYL